MTKKELVEKLEVIYSRMEDILDKPFFDVIQYNDNTRDRLAELLSELDVEGIREEE